MSFASLLDSFRGMPVLVVGDLMLDEYHFGHATRISPEAPVMVIRHEKTTHLPGGAANVALNLKALGAEPVLIGVAGTDPAGQELAACLESNGFIRTILIRAPGRRTTKKTRIVADHAHQVLRMDSEDDAPLDPLVEKEVLRALESAIPEAKAVVLSDYLKGVLSPSVSREAVSRSRSQNSPVVVNPKPRSLAQYAGASLVSLNRAEAAEALGLTDGLKNEAALSAAMDLKNRFKAESVLITLGEAGMAAAANEAMRIPAPKVEVYDTAGAGDTVVATAALGLATSGFTQEILELAAQAAACVVRHVGVATPSPADLAAIRAH